MEVFLHHVLDRLLILLPAAAVAEILVRKLPALQRIGEPVAEPAQLLVRRNMQEQLHHPHPIVEQHLFELIDLLVGPLPFGRGGEAFDPLDQHAAVPGAVERSDLAVLRQALPKTLEVMQ